MVHFTTVLDDSQLALRTIIETTAAKKDKVAGSDEQKLGDFYQSYMNETAIEALGVQPLAADLAKITALKDHNEVTTLLAQLQQDGISTPLSWYVNNDAKNSSQYAVYLGQSGLGLPDRDYYLKDDEKSEAIRADISELSGTDMLTLAGVADAEQSR